MFEKIVFSLCLVFVIGIFIRTLNAFKKSFKVKDWMSIDAQVISREVKANAKHGYSILFESKYWMAEKDYICSDVYVDARDCFNTPDEANSFMVNAQVGEIITVFVNPNKFSESVMSKKTHTSRAIAALIFTSFVILILGLNIFLIE